MTDLDTDAVVAALHQVWRRQPIRFGDITDERWQAHQRAQHELESQDPAGCERCRTAHRTHHQPSTAAADQTA